MLLAVGGALAWYQIPRSMGAGSWSEVGEVVQVAERAARAGNVARSSGGDPTAGEPPRDAARAFDDFFDELEATTLSRADVSRVGERLSRWDDSREVREFNEVYERVRELENTDEMSLQTLMSLRYITRVAFRANDLGRAYRQEVEDAMGPEYRQVLALARVSRLGSGRNVEPWDQSVADALLRDHDENRERYREARSLLDRIRAEEVDPEELSEQERARLTEAYADHALLVTSALNRRSLVAWAQLGNDERREIMERLDAPHNWVARVSAAILHGDPEEEHMTFIRMLGF
ncbi:MAG: hypothetical protein EA422_00355 [Gemmatimonadales bacterium]|nr:MAG: hypothetical protein EA422_00355 [Gemmatimonadales bacterium]